LLTGTTVCLKITYQTYLEAILAYPPKLEAIDAGAVVATAPAFLFGSVDDSPIDCQFVPFRTVSDLLTAGNTPLKVVIAGLAGSPRLA